MRRKKKSGSRLLLGLSILFAFLVGIIVGELRVFPYQFSGFLQNSIQSNAISSTNKSTEFPDLSKEIYFTSHLDGTQQPMYFYGTTAENLQPLVVELHNWGGDYNSFYLYDEISLPTEVQSRNWNYIRPNLRGPNNSPSSCCSKLAIGDLEDAIAYAIQNSKVDPKRIVIVGGSGGGYTALCALMKLNRDIKEFHVWAPIVDLEAWYHQLISSNIPYDRDILNCTNSSNQKLNVTEARVRSPLYMNTPTNKFGKTKVKIYAGINDGYSGSVPITHSINFYNKILSDLGAEAPDQYIKPLEKLYMIENRLPPNSSSLKHGKLDSKREILYQKIDRNLALTIFDGGHDMVMKQVLKDLENALQ